MDVLIQPHSMKISTLYKSVFVPPLMRNAKLYHDRERKVLTFGLLMSNSLSSTQPDSPLDPFELIGWQLRRETERAPASKCAWHHAWASLQGTMSLKRQCVQQLGDDVARFDQTICEYTSKILESLPRSPVLRGKNILELPLLAYLPKGDLRACTIFTVAALILDCKPLKGSNSQLDIAQSTLRAFAYPDRLTSRAHLDDLRRSWHKHGQTDSSFELRKHDANRHSQTRNEHANDLRDMSLIVDETISKLTKSFLSSLTQSDRRAL